MDSLGFLLDATATSAPLPPENAPARALSGALDMPVYGRSVVASPRAVLCLAKRGLEKRLCAVARHASALGDIAGEARTVEVGGEDLHVKVGPADAANAVALRRRFDWLVARPAGVRATMGCGDRLGIATPAHARAVRGTGVFAILAQQSIREMERTGRSPQQVMDSATWGAFEEGWREGFGADADHLKTPEHVDRCAAAGFVMFTVDPGDHVDNAAQRDAPEVLRRKVSALPWADLEAAPEQWHNAYAGNAFDLGEGVVVRFTEADLLRAAAKYGRAIAHTRRMYRHVAERMAGRPFELEMSVDETDTPTSPAEHYFIASELRRLGVEWVSLAPRFVGDFEKGVDYRGCLAEFKHALKAHVLIARRFGPYKISLHSGSDKFTIYPIAAQVAGGLVHLKTAGTSYLEALRALARVEPGLFREILAFAHERYEEDRATYHVSARREEVPSPDDLADDELAGVLDADPGRQLLHVTYGSVLTAMAGGRPRFKDRLMAALKANEDVHYEVLAAHIRRHVGPIAPAG